jgi:hypothetical protein
VEVGWQGLGHPTAPRFQVALGGNPFRYQRIPLVILVVELGGRLQVRIDTVSDGVDKVAYSRPDEIIATVGGHADEVAFGCEDNHRSEEPDLGKYL